MLSSYGQQQHTLASGASGTYPNKGQASSQTLTASKTVTLTDANSLNDFIGGGSNINPLLTTTAGENVTVQYNYTLTPNAPVAPEPSTCAVLGMGAVGTGVVLRRRRRAGA